MKKIKQKGEHTERTSEWGEGENPELNYMKMLGAFAERKSYKLVMKNASLDRPQTIKRLHPDDDDDDGDDNLDRAWTWPELGL